MSYDVSYEVYLGNEWCDTGYWYNYTSNCAPMWRAAGCDIAEFDGEPVTEFAAALELAVAEMKANPDVYEAMNPPNGWGDATGCRENFLEPLLRAAQMVNPEARVVVSR